MGNGVCGENNGRVRTKRAVAKAGSKKKMCVDREQFIPTEVSETLVAA